MARRGLTPNMIKGIHLFVHANMNQTEVAKELDLHRDTVVQWFSKPHFLEAFDQAMHAAFKEQAAVAKTVMMDLMMNAESEKVRLDAAKDFMSKAGYDAADRVETTNRTIQIALTNAPEPLTIDNTVDLTLVDTEILSEDQESLHETYETDQEQFEEEPEPEPEE